MKRTTWTLVIIAVISASVALRADPWKKSVDLSLTLTQGAYSDNWVGGEVATISWMFNSNSLAEKQINAKMNTKNTLKLSFGQQHNQDQDTREWRDPLKVNDLIDFETILRFTLGGFVDPYASGRVESQFLDQSDLENERYVNPLRLTESAGIAKVLIKEEKREWSLRLGAALRQLADRDRRDLETSALETAWTNDGGIQFVSDFVTPVGDTTPSLIYRVDYSKGEFSGFGFRNIILDYPVDNFRCII